MLTRIFPKQLDNASYRGHWLAIVILAAVVIVRFMMGFNSVVFTRSVAGGPDGFLLDSYGAEGAGALLLLFAQLGFYLALFALLGAVVLVRYRAMIPLAYLFFLAQELGSKAILFVHPVARSGVGDNRIATYIVLGVLAATAIGFLLSLTNRPRREVTAAAAH
jgi:hypothetical protein